MLYLATKALISGVIVMVVSELARRSAALGALVVSLPLISILALLWLYHETHDAGRVADQSQATFCCCPRSCARGWAPTRRSPSASGLRRCSTSAWRPGWRASASRSRLVVTYGMTP